MRHPRILLLTSILLCPIAANAWDPTAICAFPEPRPVAFCPDNASCPSATWMPQPDAALAPPDDVPLDDDDARVALARVETLVAQDRLADAILALRDVASALPRLADRVALREGELRMLDGADPQACEAFARATQSPQPSLATQAEIAQARCLLALHDRAGVELAEALVRRYPELPYEAELAFLHGEALEAWGEPEAAARLYVDLDLRLPASPFAARARERLSALREGGTRIREPSLLARVDRAERLARSGPPDLAHEAIDALASEALTQTMRQQLARAGARLARVEGRWADAQALLRQALGLPTLETDERAALEEQEQDLSRAAREADQEAIERDLRALIRGRPLDTVPTSRLFAVLHVCARGALRDQADATLAVLADRSLPPGLRFDAAILAAGTASDEPVAELFGTVVDHPTRGVAARYHRARALERLGRLEEAIDELRVVLERDDPRLPYYALWARQRIRAIRASQRPEPSPQPLALIDPLAASCQSGPYTPRIETSKSNPPSRQDATCTLPAPPPSPYVEAEQSATEVAPAEDPLAEADAQATDAELAGVEAPALELSDAELVRRLRPIADAQAEAFPWIARAIDLIAIGDRKAAADELHETFLAWREATGQSPLRAGLAAVLRGDTPPRRRVSAADWRARRLLSAAARHELAVASAALGDAGLAIRFEGSFAVCGPRPRPYREIVEAAAARHELDPDLLFAVMRVESVYNPRIISYAGAIGLMQIMPRTGRLIAHAMERDDFTIDQLLLPEVNIEMAAWYLRSLIDRFEGRVPLAIAAYNGGPHNVRRWMRDHASAMPLDAFLERIPFDQTHRYVRRVLTHYAAYRAQRGLALDPLSVELPPEATDTVAF
ncbi:MAG: transglycosylase SLT domain-containing protein [Sandaracinaceae bacterium]|nr:transglycosylase SLT domain-containing protein [Sandaracinaceae bacterium]